jgi:hypothetical protein
MKPKFAQMIADAAQDELQTEVSARDDYSGRGMYGDTTGAVVGSLHEIIPAIALVAFNMGEDQENGPDMFDDFIQEVSGLSQDSMGRSDIVLY